jgi:hypothetical protein
MEKVHNYSIKDVQNNLIARKNRCLGRCGQIFLGVVGHGGFLLLEYDTVIVTVGLRVKECGVGRC